MKKPFMTLRPPEMERLTLTLKEKGTIKFVLEDMGK